MGSAQLSQSQALCASLWLPKGSHLWALEGRLCNVMYCNVLCCCCCCCRYKGIKAARPPPDPIEMSRLARQAEGFEARLQANPEDLEVRLSL